MEPPEAIYWLQAILEDMLDPSDEGDAKRIQAVELAITALRAQVRSPVALEGKS